jgi:hypothetical protein
VPEEGELAGVITRRLSAEASTMKLTQALADPLPGDATPAERFMELTGIVTELYARLARHRIAIKLVDRCAPELPDLAAVWHGSGSGRQAQIGGK